MRAGPYPLAPPTILVLTLPPLPPDQTRDEIALEGSHSAAKNNPGPLTANRNRAEYGHGNSVINIKQKTMKYCSNTDKKKMKDRTLTSIP